MIDQGQIAGRVTSIAKRTTIGQAIGLAFVRPDFAAPGTQIRIRVDDRRYAEAQVTELPFYDRENARQRL